MGRYVAFSQLASLSPSLPLSLAHSVSQPTPRAFSSCANVCMVQAGSTGARWPIGLDLFAHSMLLRGSLIRLRFFCAVLGTACS
jgi:hypothetical protein